MVESGKSQVEAKGQKWNFWREMVMPMAPEQKCGLKSLSEELYQSCVFYHALSRPRFGVLHPSQDRWKGPPLERPLPIQQAHLLEQRYSPEQRFPPEQPHTMTPERSKFVSEGRWRGRFASSLGSRFMVPPHPLQASHHPQGL